MTAITVAQLLDDVDAGAAARLPEIIMRVLRPTSPSIAPERRLTYALHCVRHRQLLGPYVRAKIAFGRAKRQREMRYLSNSFTAMTDVAFARANQELLYRDQQYHQTPCTCSPTRR